jgi:hypothetical protein
VKTVSTRVTDGEAFVEGRRVAFIELQEEWIEDVVRVPLPGTGRDGYKDLSHSGQAYVRFTELVDPGFSAQLERLVEYAGADLDRQRAMRNAGQRGPLVIDLLVDGRNLMGAHINAPAFGHMRITDAMFPAALPS